jgi:hypothetical protein
MGFFSRIFGRRKTNKSFMDSVPLHVPRCVKNGSNSLGLRSLENFDFGKENKRNKYEELKQTTGLSIMVLESKVAELQEQLDSILMQRDPLWQEMRKLQEQFGVMQSASSEPQPTSRRGHQCGMS